MLISLRQCDELPMQQGWCRNKPYSSALWLVKMELWRWKLVISGRDIGILILCFRTFFFLKLLISRDWLYFHIGNYWWCKDDKRFNHPFTHHMKSRHSDWLGTLPVMTEFHPSSKNSCFSPGCLIMFPPEESIETITCKSSLLQMSLSTFSILNRCLSCFLAFLYPLKLWKQSKYSSHPCNEDVGLVSK